MIKIFSISMVSLFLAFSGVAFAQYTSEPSCAFNLETGSNACGGDDYQSIYADTPEEAPKNCRCRTESGGGFKYLSHDSTTTTYVEPQVAYMPCSCDTPGASGAPW